jgi:uncharacterized OB-fold protein
MALIERVTKQTDLTAWQGAIPVNWLYTAGRAGEIFVTHLKDKGELLGAYCPNCDTWFVPPKIYCEQCFARLEDDYRPVSGRGYVYSFTLCTLGRKGESLAAPQLMALIELEGTDALFLHRLGEIPPEEVFMGMPVEMVMKPEGERKGSILDIAYFRPAGE